jgi:signal transduction histidine kinase
MHSHRTALALALTAVAVVLPCASWYLVGSREARQQEAAVVGAARRSAQETAVRLAEQLGQRLEALREAESRRPFYHYQPFFHDPRGASEGASVVPSPLATGTGDPLIRAHFQAEGASGRVSLPSSHPELVQQYEAMPTQQVREHMDEQRFLQRELERGLASILFAVRQEAVKDLESARQEPRPAQGAVAMQAGEQQAAGPQARVEVLDLKAWVQNLDAAGLYDALKRGQPAPREGKAAAPQAPGSVEILVGALKWRTLYVAGAPSLVALRDVTTPAGSLIQGLLLADAGLADFFRAGGLPAMLRPGAPAGDFEAPIPLAGEPWSVAVDAGAANAAAERRAHDIRVGFLRLFSGGVAVAGMAGLCVVGLVWQAERLARQRARFAASAAHELRTPLAGLRIFSDMLAEGLGDPAKAQSYARRISDEAGRLGRVVANVLGFTRLERGSLRARPVPGDLGAAVRECVDRHRAALEAAGARLEVGLSDPLPEVAFDRDAVAQILQNLLDNAEKHTRSSGDRTIRLSVAPTGGGIELAVADRGPGVPPDVRRRLFEPFARNQDADAPAGLGLGLVLVKALAEAQGATASYADNPGGGARFAVRFPLPSS